MMPVMDGKELVQAIRNNDLISHLPVILLSARAGEEARIDGLDAGADDYLVKPFSGKELLAKVRSQINIAKARNHAEELLKQLFINAPMAIAIFRGRNFVVELANDMILELWGRKLEDVLHKTWWDAFPEIADQHYIPDLFRKVFETGERQIYPEHCVELIRYGVLEKVYVKSIYEPLRDVNGQITGVIALAHEITDLVLARTAAQKSAEEMLDLANRKDEFMSIASHELKTPITSMKASLQILERLPLDDRASNFVGKANRQMSRLSALVGDLLDVTSLQAGKMKFYFESFSLNDMLADVIEQHEQSQSTHQITLMADDEILIHADRNRLEQVVNNLLSNAIKYSPQSNRVMVITEKTEGRIRVCVRDFGIGIPPDKVDQIFDRFYRVEESSQNFAGLGLGLFISSEIIKRHHGEIGVYRNEDVGSTFWFTLPN
jgi:two-component system CheB/CheR fusion protein